MTMVLEGCGALIKREGFYEGSKGVSENYEKFFGGNTKVFEGFLKFDVDKTELMEGVDKLLEESILTQISNYPKVGKRI